MNLLLNLFLLLMLKQRGHLDANEKLTPKQNHLPKMQRTYYKNMNKDDTLKKLRPVSAEQSCGLDGLRSFILTSYLLVSIRKRGEKNFAWLHWGLYLLQDSGCYNVGYKIELQLNLLIIYCCYLFKWIHREGKGLRNERGKKIFLQTLTTPHKACIVDQTVWRLHAVKADLTGCFCITSPLLHLTALLEMKGHSRGVFPHGNVSAKHSRLLWVGRSCRAK